jgi:hypothetical protein
MFSHGNKTKVLILILIILSIDACCSDADEKQDLLLKSFKEQEQFEKLNQRVLALANDTVKHWISLDLKYFHVLRKFKYVLDSQVYFNSTKDKCFLFVLTQDSENNSQDMIYSILGEKYKDDWWFYNGPTYVIERTNYTSKNINDPLPFAKLRDISRENTFDWYYLKKENTGCFKLLFSSGYSEYKKCTEQKYVINDQYFEYELNVALNPDPKKESIGI